MDLVQASLPYQGRLDLRKEIIIGDFMDTRREMIKVACAASAIPLNPVETQIDKILDEELTAVLFQPNVQQVRDQVSAAILSRVNLIPASITNAVVRVTAERDFHHELHASVVLQAREDGIKRRLIYRKASI